MKFSTREKDFLKFDVKIDRDMNGDESFVQSIMPYQFWSSKGDEDEKKTKW